MSNNNNDNNNSIFTITKIAAISVSAIFTLISILTYYNIVRSSGLFANVFGNYILTIEIYAAGFCLSIFFITHALNKVKQNADKKLDQINGVRLAELARTRDEIVSLIDSASCVEDFNRLQDIVTKHNAEADDFYKKYGITPKKITFADFEAKRERFLQTKGK